MPGSPFQYYIPVTGKRPLQYSIDNLSSGLVLDQKTGIITGKIQTSGKYSVILKAKNEFGDSRKNFTIQVGTGLALTPPMGWNSWNVWALMSAPLLIGADLTKLNPFTFNLLSNREVIDIDQDILGKPAKRFKVDDLLEIWTKELSDGSVVVGLCNFGIQKHNIELNMKTIGLEGQYIIRDVWRQKDIGDLKGKFIANVKPHEVKLLKLIKKNN